MLQLDNVDNDDDDDDVDENNSGEVAAAAATPPRREDDTMCPILIIMQGSGRAGRAVGALQTYLWCIVAGGEARWKKR